MSQRGGGVQPAARHLFERSFFRAVATSIPPHMYSLQNRRFCFRAVATSEHSVAVSDRISNQKHDPEVDPVVLCYFAMRDPALPVVRWLSDVIII